MKVLVTGAAGFLGRHTTAALVARGHTVRALVRSPHTELDGAEVVRADLRHDDLGPALDGVEVVLHLAAVVAGTDEERFAGTVPPTERLVAALEQSGVRRLVLVSTYAVYDWSRARGVLDESCPLEHTRLYERDGYACAKVWQERVARRASAAGSFELVVLRPGFVWGPGRLDVAGAGVPVGKLQLVVAPAARLPLTYVENCADCVAAGAEHPAAAGLDLNVVDGDGVSAWRYTRAWRPAARPVPVPYGVGLAVARMAQKLVGLLSRHGGRLPSLLQPRRYEARFRPLRHSAAEARRVLGWEPRIGFDEAMRRSTEG